MRLVVASRAQLRLGGGVERVVGEATVRMRDGERREGVGGPRGVARPVAAVRVEQRRHLEQRGVDAPLRFRRGERRPGVGSAVGRRDHRHREVGHRTQRRVARADGAQVLVGVAELAASE